jgi:hypothetical protein
VLRAIRLVVGNSFPVADDLVGCVTTQDNGVAAVEKRFREIVQRLVGAQGPDPVELPFWAGYKGMLISFELIDTSKLHGQPQP